MKLERGTRLKQGVPGSDDGEGRVYSKDSEGPLKGFQKGSYMTHCGKNSSSSVFCMENELKGRWRRS